MPNVIGSIPDRNVGPLVDYFREARGSVGFTDADYNELLYCLLVALMEAGNGVLQAAEGEVGDGSPDEL